MTLLNFKARNHPQQVKRRGANRHVDDMALPADYFANLNGRFNLTIDVAASLENAKLDRYYTESDSAFDHPWHGERVYCNPPYSNIGPWIEKAHSEVAAKIIVMLLPANRTEQKWWQELVEPYRDKAGSALRVEFLPGRLRFLKPGQKEIGPNERPPFGCCLLIWKP